MGAFPLLTFAAGRLSGQTWLNEFVVPARYAPTPNSRTEEKPLHWYRDSTAALYSEAVERNLPFMLVFLAPSGKFSDDLETALTNCAVVARLEPVVLFGLAHPDKDVVARNMATALGVAKLPTISILEPDPKIISELGRIEGVEAAATVTDDIVRLLGQGHWPNAVRPLSDFPRPEPWRPGPYHCWPTAGER
jgi:hypothetical protein